MRELYGREHSFASKLSMKKDTFFFFVKSDLQVMKYRSNREKHAQIVGTKRFKDTDWDCNER